MTRASAEIARSISTIEQRLRALERASSLRQSSLDGNSTLKAYDDNGYLRATIGIQDDLTYGLQIRNAPASLPPTAPVVVGDLGYVTVYWDGLLTGSTEPPRDLARVDVHASWTDDFTPAGINTVMGSFFPGVPGVAGGGTLTIPLPSYDTLLYVKLVAVNLAGTESAPSAQGSAFAYKVGTNNLAANSVNTTQIVNGAVTDAKVFSLTATKITAGVISSNITVSGRIATALTGARVELNATGVHAYDTGGVETFRADTTGYVQVLGGVTATSLSGARVELNPTGVRAYNGVGAEVFTADTSGNVALTGAIYSTNYLESEAGFRFTETGAGQVESLAALGAVSADTMSTSTITVGGADLMSEVIAMLPKGLIGYARTASWALDSDQISTEKALFEFKINDLSYLRYYKFVAKGPVTPDTANTVWRLMIRYTEDGSTPGLTSDILDSSTQDFQCAVAGTRLQAHVMAYYSPTGADVDTMRFIVTLQRMAGTGTAYAEFNDDNLAWQVGIEDMGHQNNATGTLVQKSFSDASTSSTPPVSTQTKSFNCTWSRSFDGSSGQPGRSPDTNDLYQGYYSSTHGNTRSMVGFGSDVSTALTGATVKKITLTYKVKHAYQSAGLRLLVSGTHGATSRPSSSGWASSGSELYDSGGTNRKEASTYTVTLFNGETSGAKATFAAGLKSGSVRGLTFGPGASSSTDYYGYLYGFGASGAPKLTVTYEK